MSAAPLDLRTPQMECPTCRATVGITKKGTVVQHTRRRTTTGWRFVTGTERCPSSFTVAPDGAHAAWLRSMIDAKLAAAARSRTLADEARAKAAEWDAEAQAYATAADGVAAALAAIGATP